MKKLKNNYTAALNKAKKSPTHVNGELQGHYQFLGNNKHFSKIMYTDQLTPVNVFESLNPRYTSATRFYVKSVPTYRENGNLKKIRSWEKRLMFHKAWSRTDIEVKNVKLDIVGIKRETAHLPAGVLIANIEFVI